jgi:hypothetical protein
MYQRNVRDRECAVGTVQYQRWKVKEMAVFLVRVPDRDTRDLHFLTPSSASVVDCQRLRGAFRYLGHASVIEIRGND